MTSVVIASYTCAKRSLDLALEIATAGEHLAMTESLPIILPGFPSPQSLDAGPPPSPRASTYTSGLWSQDSGLLVLRRREPGW